MGQKEKCGLIFGILIGLHFWMCIFEGEGLTHRGVYNGSLQYYLKSEHHKQVIQFEKYYLHTLALELEILCKACLLFVNIVSDDRFFHVLIIGLFQIGLFKDQTLGEMG